MRLFNSVHNRLRARDCTGVLPSVTYQRGRNSARRTNNEPWYPYVFRNDIRTGWWDRRDGRAVASSLFEETTMISELNPYEFATR
jgi:hypothetical protein